MECQLAHQKIALLAYGELPDDQCPLLESHLRTCKSCEEELTAVQALQQAISLTPVLEPSANLLAQARLRLEEALDEMPSSSWILRAQQALQRSFGTLGRAPVAASALLVLGLGSGGWAGYQVAARHPRMATPSANAVAPSANANAATATAAASTTDSGTIASISSIIRQPHSEQVEVHYNRLVSETAEGSLDDPSIRRLLLAGATSQQNPVAQSSVALLAEECQAGHSCTDGPIRQALLVALRYDKNARVRLGALNGLKPYVGEDMRVRDAVLEALMSDPDATIRTRAVELLRPVEADTSVREVLHTVANGDHNPYIRTVSQQVLDQPMQIQ